MMDKEYTQMIPTGGNINDQKSCEEATVWPTSHLGKKRFLLDLICVFLNDWSHYGLLTATSEADLGRVC